MVIVVLGLVFCYTDIYIYSVIYGSKWRWWEWYSGAIVLYIVAVRPR